MQSRLSWILAAILFSLALPAQAQHSDVTFDIDANQIVIESEGHDHDHDGGEMHGGEEGHSEEGEHSGGLMTWDGKWLFEGDFGDLGGGPFVTDDPGFATIEETGVLNPGELIGFEGVGSLKFWDWDPVTETGIWTSSTDATLSIEDIIGAVTTIDEFGVTPGTSTTIDAADDFGGLHAHIDFSINEDADLGAYLIELLLTGSDPTGTTQAYLPSDSFLIAFNLGLDEEAYEAGVDARVVPLPGAIWMLLSGLSLLGFMRARRAS